MALVTIDAKLVLIHTVIKSPVFPSVICSNRVLDHQVMSGQMEILTMSRTADLVLGRRAPETRTLAPPQPTSIVNRMDDEDCNQVSQNCL